MGLFGGYSEGNIQAKIFSNPTLIKNDKYVTTTSLLVKIAIKTNNNETSMDVSIMPYSYHVCMRKINSFSKKVHNYLEF